ncbi:uncharacterized protein SOCE836_065450 [Sorangium cellulosum]|uniref:Uncharacterized protein n=1 Tax=Sorangium cellulosum TaxID=56 RepID=A0A4V0NGU3_SORCE|nr:uncharacterized protein SOCE836_065450 [Sorangium cellulosum]
MDAVGDDMVAAPLHTRDVLLSRDGIAVDLRGYELVAQPLQGHRGARGLRRPQRPLRVSSVTLRDALSRDVTQSALRRRYPAGQRATSAGKRGCSPFFSGATFGT